MFSKWGVGWDTGRLAKKDMTSRYFEVPSQVRSDSDDDCRKLASLGCDSQVRNLTFEETGFFLDIIWTFPG